MHVKARSPFLSDLKSDEVSLIGTKEEEEEEPWHGFHWLVVSFRQIIANERQYTFFILCRFSVKQCVKVVWILDPIRIAQRFERSSRLHVCFDHESKGGPSPYSHRNSVNHESVPLPGTHYLKYIVTNVMNYRSNNSVNPESTMFRVRRNRQNLSCKWRVENIFKVKLMKSFDKRWSRFRIVYFSSREKRSFNIYLFILEITKWIWTLKRGSNIQGLSYLTSQFAWYNSCK